LGIYFFIVSLVPLAIAGYISYRIAEQSLRKDIVNQLLAVSEAKARSIETYALERRRNVTMLARDPAIIDAIERYKEAFKTGSANSPDYIAIDRKLRPFLTYYKETAGYDNLFLVSSEQGVIFSVNSNEDLGKKHLEGPERNSEMVKTFDRAKTLLETEISDFEVNAETGVPTAFIAAPVFKGSQWIGMVAFQMKNEELYDLVRDYTGLQQTGEIVIASKRGNEAVFITPVRNDPDASFKRRILLGSDVGIPIQKAVEAKKGSGVYVDYRGKNVLAAWRYLPSFGSGIVVKIDAEEAFSLINNLRDWWIGIGLIATVMVVVLTIFFAKSISVPIRRLTQMTKRIASGDLNASVEINSEDEIGELAESFVNMQTELKKSIKTLTETTAAKERIESELNVAREIQMSILPKIFPPFPDRKEFEIYAVIEPAKEVGGDFYDFFFIDEDHMFFLIGDVSGKGVPASLYMAVTKTLIKAITNKGMSPDEVLDLTNKELCKDNETLMFVTIFCGIIDTRTGVVSYSCGGHNPPYIISQTKGVKELKIEGGMALGIMDEAEFNKNEFTLGVGDVIFLFTDGVTEAFDCHGNMYSDERLKNFLENLKGFNPEVTVKKTLNEVNIFSSGAPQADDITLLTLKYRNNG